MDTKNLIYILCLFSLASCSTNASRPTQEWEYFSRFALAICLGSSFDSDAVKTDFNRAANGYMERGNMSIESIDELRVVVDKWLAKDYPSKHGGQVNSAKCFDFYRSRELIALFNERITVTAYQIH